MGGANVGFCPSFIRCGAVSLQLQYVDAPPTARRRWAPRRYINFDPEFFFPYTVLGSLDLGCAQPFALHGRLVQLLPASYPHAEQPSASAGVLSAGPLESRVGRLPRPV